jgi:hypothetical protein
MGIEALHKAAEAAGFAMASDPELEASEGEKVVLTTSASEVEATLPLSASRALVPVAPPVARQTVWSVGLRWRDVASLMLGRQPA